MFGVSYSTCGKVRPWVRAECGDGYIEFGVLVAREVLLLHFTYCRRTVEW
jgi:hypothetical protein